MMAGIKPVRSMAAEIMRKNMFGILIEDIRSVNGERVEIEEIGRYGDSNKLKDRLQKTEEILASDDDGRSESLKAIFRERVLSRYDRVRCRVHPVGIDRRFHTSSLIGEVKWQVNGGFYQSDWKYGGETESEEVSSKETRIRDMYTRTNTGRKRWNALPFFYNGIREMRDHKVIKYMAWHVHLPVWRKLTMKEKNEASGIHKLLPKKATVEIQIYPFDFAKLNYLLERVFKQDKPGLSHVAKELIPKAVKDTEEFLPLDEKKERL